MARSRFTGSTRMVRGPKRLTQWGLGPGGSAGDSVSASSSVILGSGVTFGASGTVVRIRGNLQVVLASFTSSGHGYHFAMGIGVVTSAAFAAGIASIPTPLTEAAWDGWMYHRFGDVHGSLAAGSTSTGQGNGASFDTEVDTKAMRKVSDEMTVVAVIELVEVGTAVVDIFFDIRLLLKLG